MLKDLFTLSGRWGRLNRIRYFGYGLLIGTISMVMMAVLVFFALSGMADGSGIAALGGAFFLLIPIYLVLLWVQICLTVKRLHDLNQSGWWLLGIFVLSFIGGFLTELGGSMEVLALLFNIPIIAMAIWLLFWPGTEGDNQYGPDPRLV